VEDDEVVLTLNSDDEVTDIDVTRDTYAHTFLMEADTDEGETHFGTIDAYNRESLAVHTLVVGGDTVILLDGEEVPLVELEEARDNFEDEYEADPIVTVRTQGDVADSDEYAIYVSVITANTVEGEVTAVGNDGEPYVRINGEKVYYDDNELEVGTDLDTGDAVTLLLGSDDVAMLVLEALIDEADLFVKVVEYTLDDGDLNTVTAVRADDTEVVLDSFDAGVTSADVADMLGDVVEVSIDASGEASFPALTALGSGGYDDHSSTWMEVDGTKYVRDAALFVYDAVADDFIELDDVDTTDNVTLYSINGVAGYVVVDDAPPTAVISSPTDGGYVAGDLDIVGEATDSSGSIEEWTLYIDGSEYATGTAQQPAGTTLYTWHTTGVADGDYPIELVVTDNAANAATHSITVTVDNTAPTAASDPMNDPMGGTFTFTGTATDANFDYWSLVATNGPAPARAIGSACTEVNAAAFVTDYNTSLLMDGDWDIVLTVTDLAGNVSTFTAPNITIDNTAPTVISVAGDGADDGETIANGSSIVIGFSETIANKDDVEDAVDIAFTGDGVLGATNLAYSWAWNVDVYELTVTNNTGGDVSIGAGSDVTSDLTDICDNTTVGAVVIDD